MEEQQINKKTINLPENVQVDAGFELMLKKFISQVKKEGILEEYRSRRYYVKPSEKKRLKAKGNHKNVR